MFDLILSKEFQDTLTTEEEIAILQALRIAGSSRIQVRVLNSMAVEKRFRVAEAIEQHFVVIAVFHEGAKCFVRECYSILKERLNGKSPAGADQLASKYSTPAELMPTNQRVMKYIRDSAAFHYKSEYLKDYFVDGPARGDFVIGFADDVAGTNMIYNGTVQIHLKEIEKRLKVKISEGEFAPFLHRLINDEVLPGVLGIEEMVGEVIATGARLVQNPNDP